MFQRVCKVCVCLRGKDRTAPPSSIRGIGLGAEVGAVERFRWDGVAGIYHDGVLATEVLYPDSGQATSGRVDAQKLAEVAAEIAGERARVDVPESAHCVHKGEVGGFVFGFAVEVEFEVLEVCGFGIARVFIQTSIGWYVVARKRIDEFLIFLRFVDLHLRAGVAHGV